MRPAERKTKARAAMNGSKYFHQQQVRCFLSTGMRDAARVFWPVTACISREKKKQFQFRVGPKKENVMLVLHVFTPNEQLLVTPDADDRIDMLIQMIEQVDV